jgi:hypothetical protein
MTDDQSPDNDSTPEPETQQRSDGHATDMLATIRTGPRARNRTIKRVSIVAASIVLVAALALTLTHFLRKDPAPAIEETAAAEVFLEPADSVGDSPFAPTGFTTAQPDPTHPGSDPLGPPPAAPAPPPEGQAAPVSMRTANGDLPGLYGGTLDTTTCDAELMMHFLDQHPNKAKAWAGVHRIQPQQIRAYVTELTPVLLRTDTRLTDHGYIEVAQALPRQAVLQAGTAVMVDKYGSPRVRCISGSPLTDPVAATAPVAPRARPAGNVAVQPAAVLAQPRVIYVGPRWPRFDPTTFVVIRRVLNALRYFFLWDFRRGVFLARQIGILIRDVANLAAPVLRGIVPLALLPRPAPPAGRPAAPLPLQPLPAPQRPPVQGLPAQVPPVQQAPAPQAPQAPAPQAPAPAAPAPVPPPVFVPQPMAPPPIVDTWDPPLVDTWDPPVWEPPMVPSHPQPGITDMPGGSMPAHPQPQIAGEAPSGGGHTPNEIPQDSGAGVTVPPITDACSNPAYPCLPSAPSSGSGTYGSVPESGSGAHDSAPVPQEVPQESSSGSDSSYTTPDYGSLPGAADTGGDPGGNLQCDPLLNPC